MIKDNRKTTSSPTGVMMSSFGSPLSSSCGGAHNETEASNEDDQAERLSLLHSHKQEQVQPKGIYAIYKQSTQDFRDSLAKLLPKSFRLVTIQDFKRGADHVMEQSLLGLQQQKQQGLSRNNSKRRSNSRIMIDESILESLGTSIRYRKAQARKYNCNDAGHAYMIAVLEYCRDVLYLANDVTRRQQQERAKQRQTTNQVGFRALVEEDGSQDVWSSATDYYSQWINKPEPPCLPTASEETLCGSHDDNFIQGDDRFQCIAFLETMDHLMGVVRGHFDETKQLCIMENLLDKLKNRNGDDDTCRHLKQQVVVSLMQGAIATNLCIECVQTTWAELTLEHAHIRSLYDLLALVFVLPNLRDKAECQGNGVDDTQRFHDVLTFTNERYPHMLLHFVADVVEACFAVGGLDMSKALGAYGSKLGLPEGDWERELFLEEAEQMASHIAGLVLESNTAFGSQHKIRQSWLDDYKFIGGRQCILNTQKVLQQCFSFMKDGEKHAFGQAKALVKAAKNTFPFDWDENINPARQICGHMDRLLAGSLLPGLLAACEAPFVDNLAIERLVPLLSSFSTYFEKSFGGPIPVDMMFGTHALLTSILALQGNDHVKFTGETARSSYIERVDKLTDSVNAYWHLHGDERTSFWFFDILENVSHPDPDIGPSSMSACWNPFMAGSFCVYSLYMGFAVESRYLQKYLKPVLHQYNALQCRRQIGKIDFLDFLDDKFENVRAIWPTGKCTSRGGFAKSFLLGSGMSVRDVSFFVDILKREQGVKTSLRRYADDRARSFVYNPKMVEMLRSHHIVQGHAALLWKEYTGITLPPNVSRHNESAVITDCEEFIAKAIQALKNDVEFFGGSFINLIGIGCRLKDFCKNLKKAMDSDEYDEMDVFGGLDFAPDSKLLFVPTIVKLLHEFFDNVSREEYAFSNGF